eukprot:CAMPEP_0116547562 /NCGR_PEP_ID=MMETSP0397-20121206/3847_1 /TAXON_ID=216820 /ORGANISM="Cyclophora tenuis, Strain ECT3854" /LENGTH=160 /DNA_ID=CAMNT_0004072109 /DNA_START=89 /DNA_END=571 /DNA_ORIENTATION=-
MSLSMQTFSRSLSSSSVVKVDDKLPSAKDVCVQLTFVDPSGARRQVTGLVGTTLHDTCVTHEIDIGPSSKGAIVEKVQTDVWTEPLFGEGPTSGFDHVLVTGNGAETIPPKTPAEQRMLRAYWEEDEIYPESRLASMVDLTKDMDGMVVFVPDRLVDDFY